MPGEQVINSPFIVAQFFLSGEFDWMNRRMGLIVEFTSFGSLPLLSRANSLGERAKARRRLKLLDDFFQVDGGIVPISFGSWITQITTVVKFLHYIHALSRTDA